VRVNDSHSRAFSFLPDMNLIQTPKVKCMHRIQSVNVRF
jgi:hypothetical protein